VKASMIAQTPFRKYPMASLAALFVVILALAAALAT